MDDSNQADQKTEQKSAGDRIEAAARAGARPSELIVMCASGGGSASAAFAWPSEALSSLNTPKGRAALCEMIETELEGWLVHVDSVPSEDNWRCLQATLQMRPMGKARRETSSLKALSRIVAPWEEPGWSKLARLLDDFFKGPSLRGRYDLSFSDMGLLGRADDHFGGAAPIGLRNASAPGLSLEDFVAQVESRAQALALSSHVPESPADRAKPRL